MAVEKEQKTVAAYVIRLTAAAVNSQKAPENKENIPWQDIIDFAKSQSVLNIVSYACETLDNKPDGQMMKYLREFRKQRMIIEAQQEIETCDALDRLEQMGVRHMPLKGYVIKNLYPSPDMRTMGDMDILVDPERIEEVTQAFIADGFGFFGDGDLHTNLKRGKAHFEFHRALVNKSYKNLTAYFGDGFDRAVKSDGCRYRYELKHEDMYIFLLAHLAKHYRYGGTGIRTVLDLYVYRRAYPDLDMNYIYAETAKIGLNRFQHKAEKIADDWFGGNFDGNFDSVSAYIISGGTYGIKDRNIVNEVINQSEGKSLTAEKIKSIFSMIFPNYKLMCELFPVLKKHKILLPFLWVARWFKSVFSKNSGLKNTLNVSAEILSADDEAIAAQRDAELGEL